MSKYDTPTVKDRIISLLEKNGPTLPVHIAKEVGQSILFTSAFLSELLAEKRLKMSYMRIGSSPLYFIEGQESMLEPFSSYLKSKEKEAFALLREKKFLKDIDQLPPIRAALRDIKDFAIPFQDGEFVFWRFFTAPQNEVPLSKPVEKEKIQEEQNEETENVETIEDVAQKTEEDIEEREVQDKQQRQKKERKLPKPKKKPKKSDDGFFNRVKEFLTSENSELLDIKDFKKNEIVLYIREDNEEKIVIALNKNKVDEKDIINASKKASEHGLKFRILSFGMPLKKTQELIESVRNLDSIEKLK